MLLASSFKTRLQKREKKDCSWLSSALRSDPQACRLALGHIDMNMQTAASDFVNEAEAVCDEISPLLDVIAATGANRARHIGVVAGALFSSITPAEREVSLTYLLGRLRQLSN